MDLYEALYTTRAMRRVKPDKIPADVQRRILDAAIRAPTGGNAQNWKFLLVEGDEKESPSVQCRVNGIGQPQVISTHDQVLGGPSGQVFEGATFPADPSYRLAIQAQAERVGQVLADDGVIGRFAVDFMAVPKAQGEPEIYAVEVNLRQGGTTHCFNTLKNEYGDFGGHFEVVHHTELLARLARSAANADLRRAAVARLENHELLRRIVVSDPSEARRIARANMKVYIGLPNYQNNLRELGFEDADWEGAVASDRLVDAIVAWGDEAALRARIQAHHDAGATHVCIQPLRADGKPGADLRVLEALAPD